MAKKGEAKDIENLRSSVGNLTEKIESLSARVDQVVRETGEIKTSVLDINATTKRILEHGKVQSLISAQRDIQRYLLTIAIFFLSASLPLYAISMTLKTNNHFAELSTFYAIMGVVLLGVYFYAERKKKPIQ